MVFEEVGNLEVDGSKETDIWGWGFFDHLTNSKGRMNQISYLFLSFLLVSIFAISNELVYDILYDILDAFSISSIHLLQNQELFSVFFDFLFLLPFLYLFYVFTIRRLLDTGRVNEWLKYARVGLLLSIISHPAGLLVLFLLISDYDANWIKYLPILLTYFSLFIAVHLATICTFFSSKPDNDYGSEVPFFQRFVKFIPHVSSYSDILRIYLMPIIGIYLFWKYCNKFLVLSILFLSTMARDITIGDTQMNTSYYPMENLFLATGGTILICFLLVQNDIPNFFRELKRRDINPISRFKSSISECSTSIFAIICFLISYILVGTLELSPGGQTPFFFFGGAVVAGIILLQDNFSEILSRSRLSLSGFFRELRISGVFTTIKMTAIQLVNKIAYLSTSIYGVLTLSIKILVAVYAGLLAGFWNGLIYFILRKRRIVFGKDVPLFARSLFFERKSTLFFERKSMFPWVTWSWKKIDVMRSINSILPPMQTLSLTVPVGSIIVFIALTLNLSLIPAISQEIPSFLSLIILIPTLYWGWRISREDMKPVVQSKRTAALAYLVFLPFILYLFLRVLYLQHDPNPVMQNRWEVQFDFMEKVNTFKINPWPIDVIANMDSRWLFLKAAIINSVRVTLLSIILCLILGTIVGVTRLSNNKLASTMATVYVEVFRNLPLAVLLFLIATQFGLQAPLFIEQRFLLGGAIFYSNQGIWFVTVESYQRLVMGLVALALLRVALRSIDRIEPAKIVSPDSWVDNFRRPFSVLGWRIEALAADLLLIVAALLFIDYLVPFVSTHGGGIEVSLAMVLLVYALSITSKIDDDGINSLQIDDSESGLRKRFTIWVAGLSIALGIALSKGLSFPEYVKDWDGDGIIDSPGSWDIAAGSGFEITPFFLAMMLGLTLFTASTVAEIVRGSIQSLPRGQVEAAISLSLNPYQRLRLVILPQALRSMVPLLNNQFMNVWKNSSLAVIVAYSDIFYVVLVMMNNVGKLIPLFLLLLFTYQIGSLAISVVMNWYNSRVTSVKI